MTVDFKGLCEKSRKPISTNVFLIGFPRGQYYKTPPLRPSTYILYIPSCATEVLRFFFFNEVHSWCIAKSYSEKKVIYFPFLLSLGKDDIVCYCTEILLKTFPA